MHYYLQKIDIKRTGSYIASFDWLANKATTINPKNEYAITLSLNYYIIKNKDLKKILEFKRVDTDFSLYCEDWENFEQNNTSVALNVLFVSHDSEEIKLAYKSNYNERKNQVIF